MKKILLTVIFLLSFFTSCREALKENINLYADKNINILVKEIVEIYEKNNKNIKINILNEKPENLKNLDIIISADENVLFSMAKEENKKDENYEEYFTHDFFTDDKIILVGRRKLNDLNDLLYSHIVSPNYDNIVGKIFIDNLSQLEIFKEISKRIEYTDDSISAMQNVDLYESDYAVINTLLLNLVKNSQVCLVLSKIDAEAKKTEEKIIYKRFINKNSSENSQKFYNFLESNKVLKIIENHKKI